MDFFSDACLYILDTYPRFIKNNPYETFVDEPTICFLAHGIVELAYEVNPKIMERFDSEKGLPWDSGLHKYLRRPRQSKSYLKITKKTGLAANWIDELNKPRTVQNKAEE